MNRGTRFCRLAGRPPPGCPQRRFFCGSRGSYTLAEYAGDLVQLACHRCERRGQCRKDTLIARYGAEVVLPDLRHYARALRTLRPPHRRLRCALRGPRSRPQSSSASRTAGSVVALAVFTDGPISANGISICHPSTISEHFSSFPKTRQRSVRNMSERETGDPKARNYCVRHWDQFANSCRVVRAHPRAHIVAAMSSRAVNERTLFVTVVLGVVAVLAALTVATIVINFR